MLNFITSFLFTTVYAQTSEGGAGGLVPCKDNCSLKDLGTLLVKIFNFLVDIAFVLAILGIAVGGVYMILGSSNSKYLDEGKDIIWYSIFGLIVALAAWVIVNTILVGLGVPAANVFKNPLTTSIF